MARIGILLTAAPFQFENWETAVNIAEAALDKGHEVAFFLYIDGVYNPVRQQSFPEPIVLPHERFMTLLERGARVIVCGICARIRGLERADYVEGVVVGGLPSFAMLIGEVDRLVSL